jgi:hypothetical protein
MKIIVLEACDGFTIVLTPEDGEAITSYWFNQEDDKTELVNLFKKLGFEAEYQEDY